MRTLFFLCFLSNLFHHSHQNHEHSVVSFMRQLQEVYRSDISILQTKFLSATLSSSLAQNCSSITHTEVSNANFKLIGRRPLIHILHITSADLYLTQARINHALGAIHMYVMIGSQAHEPNKDLFKDVLKLIWLENIREGKLMIKHLKCNSWSKTHIWTPQEAREFRFSSLFQRFQLCNRPLFSIPVFAVTANNLFLLKNPLTKTVDFHGYEKSMVDEFGKDMGFQAKLIFSRLGDLNGTDALGLVHSERAEMTMGFLSLTHLRSKYFAFSYPHEDSVIGMFMQRPNSLKKWLAIVWPLDNLTWLAIIVNVLLFTLAFWLWLGPRSTPILSAFGVVLSFILKKGLTGYHLNGRIRRHKTRLFLLGWIAAIVFLKIWYKTTLRAVLISPWQHSPPETLEDVLKEGPTLYVLSGTSADRFLSNLDVPAFKELRNSPNYKRISYGDLPQIMRMIQNDASKVLMNGVMSNYGQTLNQVFNSENDVQKIFAFEGQTGLVVLKDTIRLGAKTFLVRKNAPYVDRMNDLIMSMLSHGLIQKWNSDAKEAIKWNNHLLVDHGLGVMAEFLDEPRWRVISTDMLLGVFLFHGIACAMGLIVLLYEIGYCAVHS